MPAAARSLFALLISVFLLTTGVAAAQDESSPDTPPNAREGTGELRSGEGELDLDGIPPDRRIEARLREILDATERFSGAAVRVDDGVVFLNGEARDEPSRALATELATRTRGVAAVVNDMTLAEGSFWSLEPALEEVESLAREAVRAVPLLLIGLVLLAVALLIAGRASRFVSGLIFRRTESEMLRSVLEKAVFLLIVLLGLYLALRITGLTRVAVTVISGTGLLGLALGFAFRDIAENFLASLLLSVQRPFRIGDVITVDGHTGVVRKVTARGTLLIDFDGNHIQIANATVYKNTIKNMTANPKMRITFAVGIGYDDRIAEAQEVARRVLADHPAVLDDPEPLVLVDNLGASTVNLTVYFWIDGNAHSVLKVKSSAVRLTVAAMLEAGISMPDEAREVIFPDGVPVLMEGEGPRADGPATGPGLPPARTLDAARPEPSASRDRSVAVESEGDLTTETVELKKQAAESRDPEEGANVLGGGPRGGAGRASSSS